MQEDALIAKELNEFFNNVVSTLNITENSSNTTRASEGITDAINKAIDKYKFHQNVLLLQKALKNQDVFFIHNSWGGCRKRNQR